jgi:hypothetical protein
MTLLYSLSIADLLGNTKRKKNSSMYLFSVGNLLGNTKREKKT